MLRVMVRFSPFHTSSPFVANFLPRTHNAAMGGKILSKLKTLQNTNQEKPKTKWNILKEHVVTAKKNGSLSAFIKQQSRRKKLLQRVHVDHRVTVIALEPLSLSDRRKSTNTKIRLD